MGKKLLFECGKKTVMLPFLSEYEAELKSGNKPLVIRLYLHEDHGHILRIDTQGGVRGYQRVDIYNETTPKTGDGFKIDYKCEICARSFNFVAKKTPSISNTNNSAPNVAATIPNLDPTFTCIHLHKAGDKIHAYNMRVGSDGKIMYCKPISLVPIS